VTVTLTNRERAHLKAKAHALEPFVHVGGAGLTDAVVAEVEKALTARELIKVKIAGDDRDQRAAVGDAICARTAAAAVARVGKVLILWRPRPLEEDAPVKPPTPTPSPAAKPSRPAMPFRPVKPSSAGKPFRPGKPSTPGRPSKAAKPSRRS
jgi:RNA-binding protein